MFICLSSPGNFDDLDGACDCRGRDEMGAKNGLLREDMAFGSYRSGTEPLPMENMFSTSDRESFHNQSRVPQE